MVFALQMLPSCLVLEPVTQWRCVVIGERAAQILNLRHQYDASHMQDDLQTSPRYQGPFNAPANREEILL
jgi:hypothetical protein